MSHLRSPPLSALPQLIKKIINMSNFQSPAWQICHFWSMRAAFLLLEQSTNHLQDDVTVYSSMLQFDLSVARIAQSPLLSSVSLYDERWPLVYATRHVRSFERGALQVRTNDWVLLSDDGGSFVGRVGEMVELVASGGSFMRMLVRQKRPIVDSFDPMRGQRLSVSTCVAATEEVVRVESTSFHELCCDDSDEDELRFTYIY